MAVLDPFAPVVGVGDTSFGTSRIFSSTPHQDGLMFIGVNDINTDSALLLRTRVAKGVWGFNRTAAGAETYNFQGTSDNIFRTGEAQTNGNFGASALVASAFTSPKGIGVKDFFAVYQVGVVPLTTATLRLGKTVYSATIAQVQTDIIAATGVPTAVSAPANPLTQIVQVPFATRVMSIDDLALTEVELQVVMANTGTLSVIGLGFHVAFNYD